MSALDRIWNGWRSQYVNESESRVPGAEGSVFTQILRSGLSDDEAYIIHRGEHTFALLNAFPYTSGHLMVLPYREVGELEDLTDDEAAELWPTVTLAVRAVKTAYSPGGVNVGINLGRAAGDFSAGMGMMQVKNPCAARTLPEPLSHSASKLRSAWGV